MSANTLIKLFSNPTYLNKPVNKFERDELLGDVYANSTHVAVIDKKTITIETPNNIVIAEVIENDTLVEFDFLSRDRVMIRSNFWMNKDSVSSLGEKLRNLPRKSFEEIISLPDKN